MRSVSPSANVRISHHTHKALKEIARLNGEPMQAVLDKAVETYRRQRFLEEAAAAYAAMRNDPASWKDELEERALWDKTNNDGLERE